MEPLVGVHDGLQLQGRQLAPPDAVLQSKTYKHGYTPAFCKMCQRKSCRSLLHYMLYAVHACTVKPEICGMLGAQCTVHAEGAERVDQGEPLRTCRACW
jgi:hypothetical protein